jgi:heme exporter protein A
VLEVSALACERGERRLFSDLGFTLPARSLLEVRGPNGSGKTTLLRALCGLFVPAAGRIAWNGEEIHALGEEYRGRVAYLGHLNAVKDDLNAAENARYGARLAGLPAGSAAVAAALTDFGLLGCRHLPCRALSQGQRRRVALARLQLAAGRPLWILDEPFSALDADAVRSTQALLESHLERGGMIALTTHQDVPLRARSTYRVELGA